MNSLIDYFEISEGELFILGILLGLMLIAVGIELLKGDRYF